MSCGEIWTYRYSLSYLRLGGIGKKLVWLLEHTRLQSPITLSVYPRILRWESSKKKKGHINISSLKPHEILAQLNCTTEEKWLLDGSLEKREEKIETEDKRENEEKEEMEQMEESTPSSLSAHLSQLSRELSSITARAAEREEQTRRELCEFKVKLDSLFSDLRSFMVQHDGAVKDVAKEGETGVVDERNDMQHDVETELEMDSSGGLDEAKLNRVVEMAAAVSTGDEKKISSITRGVKRRADRQPSVCGLSPFERLDKKEKKRQKAKKSGKSKKVAVIPVTDEEIPLPLPTEKSFVEERRNFCGRELLPPDDVVVVDTFLSTQIDNTKVIDNQWSGFVTRKHIHEIIFGDYIVDDAIDFGVQFLQQKISHAPDQYHTWGYMPALVLHNLLSRKGDVSENVHQLKTYLPNVEKFELIFFGIFTHNHWHLLMVDVKNHCATAYNSLKVNKYHMSAAKKLVTIVNDFLCNSGILKEPLKLVFDDECPTQPPESSHCAIYVLKFIEKLCKKGELTWDFSEDDIHLFRAQLGVQLLRASSGGCL